jgi:gamma-glutamyltranspeptidase
MRKDVRPKGSPITEVPIVPVHEDMDGRDEPDQHPISAITGLEDGLASKVDKATGKGLSTEDYTTAEKAKLSLVEDNAERNVVETVKVNGELTDTTLMDGTYYFGIFDSTGAQVGETKSISVTSGTSNPSTVVVKRRMSPFRIPPRAPFRADLGM